MELASELGDVRRVETDQLGWERKALMASSLSNVDGSFADFEDCGESFRRRGVVAMLRELEIGILNAAANALGMLDLPHIESFEVMFTLGILST